MFFIDIRIFSSFYVMLRHVFIKQKCNVTPYNFCKVTPYNFCKVSPYNYCKVSPYNLCKVSPYILCKVKCRVHLLHFFHCLFNMTFTFCLTGWCEDDLVCLTCVSSSWAIVTSPKSLYTLSPPNVVIIFRHWTGTAIVQNLPNFVPNFPNEVS